VATSGVSQAGAEPLAHGAERHRWRVARVKMRGGPPAGHRRRNDGGRDRTVPSGSGKWCVILGTSILGVEALMRSVTIVLAMSLTLTARADTAVAQAVGAARTAPSQERSWKTPWDKTRPRDPYVDRQGRVWFVGQVGNYVAYLEPRTGAFKRYAIDPGTNPHNLVVDRTGMVWFTGNANGRLVKMDPVSGKLTTFLMPDSTVRDPHTMVFDRRGDVWFTAQGAGVVGRLTQVDGKIRLWRMAAGSRPYGIWLDSHDQPWFDLFGTNQIGTIEPGSGKFRGYTLPNERTRPRRIAITPDDAVWYGDYTRGFLGRLDPVTGAVQEYALPSGLAALPYAMTVDDRGRIWVAETGVQPNRLVAFDPAKKTFVETIPIPADGPNAIRNMVFDRATRQIWFGGDANMIGRVQVSSGALVP
jgi:virginiamycin B lyase